MRGASFLLPSQSRLSKRFPNNGKTDPNTAAREAPLGA